MLPLIAFILWCPATSVYGEEINPDEVWIWVNLWKRKLYVMEGHQIKKEFMIGFGKRSTPTPIGEWKIADKGKNWGGGFGACWIGLNVPWGRYGIHGTNKPYSVGKPTSHGCLRMFNQDVKLLYEMVPLGSRVIVDGPIFGMDEDETIPKLVRGKKGTLVQLVQNRLFHAGYYQGKIDGIFGKHLEEAVIRFQEDHGLEKDGQMDVDEYLALGLWE